MAMLDGLPAMLIGAHAAAVYAPERSTSDVDLVVAPEAFFEAERRLTGSGWTKQVVLAYLGTKLGLYRSAWRRAPQPDIDLISSDAAWLQEAFAAPPVFNRWNQRVLPLAFLVLIKLDSARGVDQGDLTRMLGRIDLARVEEIIAVVQKHYADEEIAADIRQYAEIGRWEYGSFGNGGIDDVDERSEG